MRKVKKPVEYPTTESNHLASISISAAKTKIPKSSEDDPEKAIEIDAALLRYYSKTQAKKRLNTK